MSPPEIIPAFFFFYVEGALRIAEIIPPGNYPASSKQGVGNYSAWFVYVEKDNGPCIADIPAGLMGGRPDGRLAGRQAERPAGSVAGRQAGRLVGRPTV